MLLAHNRQKTIKRRPQTKPVRPAKQAPESDDQIKRIQDLENRVTSLEKLSTFAATCQPGRVQPHFGRHIYASAFTPSPYKNRNHFQLPAIHFAPNKADLRMRTSPNNYQSRSCMQGKMPSLLNNTPLRDELQTAKIQTQARVKKEDSWEPTKICEDTGNTRDHPIVVE